ncbi:MAG: hypothetical protein WBE28_09165 [bacterium]
MKKVLFCSFLLLFLVAIDCGGEEEEPLICHLYGYMINNDNQQGVNNLIVRIYDINPYNVNSGRLRYDTTMTQDSIAGFFEMDSVCYGTSKRQGNLVTIGLDGTENPNWPNQFYTPDIFGEVDTVFIYILPSD